VLRRRIIATLLRRFDQRVVTIAAGPGFGKTTALAQALAENRLARRGCDTWLACEPDDSHPEQLATALTTALGARRALDPITAIVDALLTRAPEPVALVLDDVHHLVATASGPFLDRLIDALPENAHLVLAGRALPALSIARFEAGGAVLRLGEHELCFGDDELQDFAQQRGVDVAILDGIGGGGRRSPRSPPRWDGRERRDT